MVGNPDSSRGAARTVWLALDDAWDFGETSSFQPPVRVDAREIGPSLRFITSKRSIERFYQKFGESLRPFILSGSGDFHHLTAIFLRQVKEPFVVLSFDNHPDWDIRPPFWSCGAWVNRALENPLVQQIAVWGCGSFECRLPWRLLGNRSACRSGRLRVALWRSEGYDYPSWLQAMSTLDWRAAFARYVESLGAFPVYVTVDLDSLRESDAITNWENGRFSLSDIVWAINLLRQKSQIIGGDLCGAFSPARYASRFQAFAGRFDHPRQRSVSAGERRAVNLHALKVIWPSLIGERLSDENSRNQEVKDSGIRDA
jgi:arginase family enzyme